LSEKTKENEEL